MPLTIWDQALLTNQYEAQMFSFVQISSDILLASSLTASVTSASEYPPGMLCIGSADQIITEDCLLALILLVNGGPIEFFRPTAGVHGGPI